MSSRTKESRQTKWAVFKIDKMEWSQKKIQSAGGREREGEEGTKRGKCNFIFKFF